MTPEDEARARWDARTIEGGYVDVPDSWWPLLAELADRLDAVWPDWQVAQVKQKLGGLRVYLAAQPPERLRGAVDVIVEAAESEAAATCERCGLIDDTVAMVTLPVSGRIGRWCGPCGDTLVWVDLLGRFYSTSGVVEELGVSVEDVANDRRLLRLTTRGGDVVYPAFQFDGGRLLPGIAEVVEILTPAVATSWTIASWLRSPQEPDVNELTPEDLLRDGQVETVVAAARRFASDLER